MVGVVELESTTSTMSTWRSNQLSYTPSCVMFLNISPFSDFASGFEQIFLIFSFFYRSGSV